MATSTRSQQPKTAAPTLGGRRRPTGVGLVVLALLTLVVVGVIVYVNRDEAKSPPETPKEPQAVALPPGLKAGGASSTFDLSTRTVGGVGRGFPQTVDGAVEASAASLEFTRTAGLELPAEDRQVLLDEFGYADAGDVDQVIEAAQDREGLDENGQPLDSQPGDRYYNECLPQYGMYNTLTTEKQPATVDEFGPAPTDMWVLIWAPCIEGIGAPEHIDDLRVSWDVYPLRWTWSDGDWQLASNDRWEWPDDSVLTPRDLQRPNVSLKERAELFGDDLTHWQLFAGYSEEWPTNLLGPEPAR